MAEKSTESFTAHYIKTNDFRTMYADGVWGGVTARGYISMSFYSERAPIPKELTYSRPPDGNQYEVTDSVTKQGAIRQVHSELLIDLAFAEGLRNWLDDKIKWHRENHTSMVDGEKPQ